MVLTDIGEIGVSLGGAVRYCTLRPSFYAMSQLGDPAEVVSIYATIMGDTVTRKQEAEQFRLALSVLYACAPDGVDVSPVFGFYRLPDPGRDQARTRERYVMGRARPRDILPLARCLLKHGVTGAQKPLPPKAGEQPEYVTEFHAREHVALAMAHIGVNEAEAWNMTMTGLVAALRAKFPPVESNEPGSRAPTKAQHEATMAQFDKIDAKRKARALAKAKAGK